MLLSAIQQLESVVIIHVCPLSPKPSFPYPTPLGHHRAPGWIPMLYTNFSATIHFTHNSIYKLMLVSPFVPLYPSPTMSTSPFSTSESPFLP